MQLILLQKVVNLGNLGDKVNVKPGYGRNFLVPQGKAVPATAANLAEFEANAENGLAGQTCGQLLASMQNANLLGVRHRSGDLVVGPLHDGADRRRGIAGRRDLRVRGRLPGRKARRQRERQQRQS